MLFSEKSSFFVFFFSWWCCCIVPMLCIILGIFNNTHKGIQRHHAHGLYKRHTIAELGTILCCVFYVVLLCTFCTCIQTFVWVLEIHYELNREYSDIYMYNKCTQKYVCVVWECKEKPHAHINILFSTYCSKTMLLLSMWQGGAKYFCVSPKTIYWLYYLQNVSNMNSCRFHMVDPKWTTNQDREGQWLVVKSCIYIAQKTTTTTKSPRSKKGVEAKL